MLSLLATTIHFLSVLEQFKKGDGMSSLSGNVLSFVNINPLLGGHEDGLTSIIA